MIILICPFLSYANIATCIRYNRVERTQLLYNFNFVWIFYCWDFHTGLSILKAFLALPILLLMSVPAPLSSLTVRPRYTGTCELVCVWQGIFLYFYWGRILNWFASGDLNFYFYNVQGLYVLKFLTKNLLPSRLLASPVASSNWCGSILYAWNLEIEIDLSLLNSFEQQSYAKTLIEALNEWR